MDKPTPHHVIRQLRDERERQGITQTEIASMLAAAGLSTNQGNISRWETGYITPRLNTMVKWADLLGLAVTVVPVPEE